MPSGLIVSTYDESEIESLANGVGDIGCCGIDRHGCTLLHLIQCDLALHVPDHQLCVTYDSCNRHTEVVRELIELLNIAVRNNVAHGCPLIRCKDNSVLVPDTDCSRSCFKHIFCHLLNLNGFQKASAFRPLLPV